MHKTTFKGFCLIAALCGMAMSASAQKQITKIVNESGQDEEPTSTLTYEFSYDSDLRLTGFKASYDDGSTDFDQSISYANGTVTVSGTVEGTECTQTYSLNEQGYATSCTATNGNKTEETTFEYTNGYLSKIVIVERYGESSPATDTYTFSYEDGNLMSATGWFCTATYGNDRNKSGLPSPVLDDELLWSNKAALYAGILGKPCEMLPTVIQEDGSTTYFSYTTDSEGYTETVSAEDEFGWNRFTYSYAGTSGADFITDSPVSVSAEGNILKVHGTDGTAVIRIFSPSGSLVYQGTKTSVGLSSGIWFVKAAGQTFKVIL